MLGSHTKGEDGGCQLDNRLFKFKGVLGVGSALVFGDGVYMQDLKNTLANFRISDSNKSIKEFVAPQ